MILHTYVPYRRLEGFMLMPVRICRRSQSWFKQE